MLLVKLVIASLVLASVHAGGKSKNNNRGGKGNRDSSEECDELSPLDVYTTLADYYNGLYACNATTVSTTIAGCEDQVFERTQDDDNGCYDENYAYCAWIAYSQMTDTLGEMYTTMANCSSTCILGAYDCYGDSEFDCLGEEYPVIAAALDAIDDKCNLLVVCGGGGFDCVTDEEDCIDQLELYESEFNADI